MSDDITPELRHYIIRELDRILGEIDVPMNTGLISRSLTQQLRGIVAAWPDVSVLGVPVGELSAEERAEHLGRGMGLCRGPVAAEGIPFRPYWDDDL